MQQKLVPGIVGISTYVDFAYQREMQLEAVRLGGTSGPINQLRSVTVTLDFNLLIANLRAGRKDAAEEQVSEACVALHKAGADFIVVTSGTTSTLTARAKKRISIPFLDLGEAAWAEVATAGPVGLLATTFAVKGGVFHAGASRRRMPLLVPSEETGKKLDDVIFGELVRGEVSASVLQALGAAARELVDAGAASIILGNTDMTQAAAGLRKACPVPLLDSALAHARAAARRAMPS